MASSVPVEPEGSRVSISVDLTDFEQYTSDKDGKIAEYAQKVINKVGEGDPALSTKDSIPKVIALFDRLEVSNEQKASLVHLIMKRNIFADNRLESVEKVLPLVKDASVMRRAVEMGLLSPESSKEEKNAALWVACHKGGVDLARRALDLGADPNFEDKNRITALLRACKNVQSDVAKLLIERGANAQVIRGTHHHQTPLSEALLHVEEMKECLPLLHEADDGFTQETLSCKLLAHRFSIDRKIEVVAEKFQTTGFRPRHVLPHYTLAAEPFYKDMKEKFLAPTEDFFDEIAEGLNEETKAKLSDPGIRASLVEQFNTVQEAMRDSLDYRDTTTEELLERLDSGIPVCLYGLVRTRGNAKTGAPQLHAWAVVITKSEEEGKFHVHRCNKGYGSGLSPGIFCGECDRDHVVEVINRFREEDDWKKSNMQKGVEFLEGFKYKYLSASDYSDSFYLGQKKQKVGNCTVANSNSMERALLYALTQPILGKEGANHFSRTIQKKRTKGSRLDTLREYLELHSHVESHAHPPNLSLLFAIYNKPQKTDEDKAAHGVLLEFFKEQWTANPGIRSELLHQLGWSELYAVWQFEGKDKAEEVIAENPDLLKSMDGRKPPLFNAVKQKDRNFFEFLVPQVDLWEEYNTVYPIDIAIIQNDLDLVKILLDGNPDRVVREKNMLQLAIYQGDDLFDLLMEQGADPNFHPVGDPPLISLAERERFVRNGELLLDLLNLLLTRGANVNALNKEGQNALMRYLISAGNFGSRVNPKVVETLLEAGLDMNTVDNKGYTALMYAIQVRDMGTANKLLKINPHIEYSARDGMTPLALACKWRQTDLALKFLEGGCSINTEISDGTTPFQFAVMCHDNTVVEAMIDKVINVDKPLVNGMTPLMIAAKNGNKKMVQLLRSKGAKMDLKDKEGKLPWMHAINAHNALDVVDLLLDEDVQVDVTDPKVQDLYRQNMHNVRKVKWFLDKGIDVNLQDPAGITALIKYVTDTDSTDFVEEILAKDGVDLNLQDSFGQTALLCAISNRKSEYALKILEKNPDIEIVSNNRQTAFSLACNNGDIQVVKRLLSLGCSVNTVSNLGWTPLHQCVNKGKYTLLKEFIDQVDDVDVRLEDSRTALMLAAGNGSKHMVELLLSKGADPMMKDISGLPAWWYAIQNGVNTEIADLLYNKGDDVNELFLWGMNQVLNHDKIFNLRNIKWFKSKGVDLNQTNIWETTLLIEFVMNGDKDIEQIRYLLSLEDTDLNAQDADGNTALMLAMKRRCFTSEIFKLLLAHGSDPKIKNKEGECPLDIDRKLIEPLLEDGGSSSSAS